MPSCEVAIKNLRDNKGVQFLLGKEVFIPTEYFYGFIQAIFAKFYFVHSGCFLQK
nr:MAG TPA: hypothetical protein [Caudoviricetes sp.]